MLHNSHSEPLVVTVLDPQCDLAREAILQDPQVLPDAIQVSTIDLRRDNEPAETQIAENHMLQDAKDLGTVQEVDMSRAGGGGGDGSFSAEVGHVYTTSDEWARIKIKPDSKMIGVGTEKVSVPGSLSKPGSGNGLGNGSGSGSLGSSGSGSGSGPGTDGIGNGTGQGRPATISRGAQGLRINGGAYPSDARREHHEGVVTLTVEVLTDGSVGQVRLAKSSGYAELDKAALGASKDWRFRPATEDGKPVTSWVNVPYRYILH